jgi:hypothetical protein
MMNNVQNVQVSDTTGDAMSYADSSKKSSNKQQATRNKECKI